MNKRDGQRFLEFPLCLLQGRFHPDEQKRFGLIISYCLVESVEKYPFSFEAERETFLRRSTFPDDCGDEEDEQLCMTAQWLEMTIHSVQHTRQSWYQAKEFVGRFEREHGRDARVRVLKDLCFQARGGQFDGALFRLHCAIRSALGKNAFGIIRRAALRYRMHGFRSKVIFEATVPNQERAGVELWIDMQITRGVKKLAAMGLVRTLHPDRSRDTFYSTALSQDQLKDAVLEFYKGRLKKRYGHLFYDAEVGRQLSELKARVRAGIRQKRERRPVQDAPPPPEQPQPSSGILRLGGHNLYSVDYLRSLDGEMQKAMLSGPNVRVELDGVPYYYFGVVAIDRLQELWREHRAKGVMSF